jgi:hypothetical protein
MRQSVSQDRDGFHVRESEFTLPPDSRNLDHQTKRTVTICDLFVNHAYTISDIVRVLDEDRRNVVHALLEQGIIRERRTKQMASPDGTERRMSVVRPKTQPSRAGSIPVG